MAATKTDICNLSQAVLGQNLFTNVDTQVTAAALTYQAMYPLARDQTIRAHTWNCCAARTVLRSEGAAQTNPKQQAINGAVWVTGLSLWVAVGASDGTRPYILTSPDGKTWTQVTTASTAVNADLMGVATDGTTVVMVGKTVGGTPLIFKTTDLSTFTQITVALNVQLNEICSYGTGKFCAVGEAAAATRPYVVYSTDSGATFTQATNAGLAQNAALYDVVWTGSTLVAVGAVSGGLPQIVTASDPSGTWTHQTTGLVGAYALNAVAWSGARLVAVGASNGTAPNTYICDDAGITWVPEQNIPKALALNSISYGNGVYVAVGVVDSTGQSVVGASYPPGVFVVSSVDGIAWTSRIFAKNVQLNAVEFGTTYFVLGGQPDGGQAYLLMWGGPSPFDYVYSYTLPSDYMRTYDVNSGDKDYKIEDGQLLTSTAYPNFRYVKLQTDVTRYDVLFEKALAAALAILVCKGVGASDTGMLNAKQSWKEAMAEARSTDAIEDGQDPQRDDPWIEGRRQGYYPLTGQNG